MTPEEDLKRTFGLAANSGPMDPATLNQFVELVDNVTSMRTDFMRRFLDPRRNLDDECGYPTSVTSTSAQQYQDLYDREAIANRVVQVLPRESWQVTPLVYEDEDPARSTEFEVAWDELGQSIRGEQSWHKDEKGSPIWEYLRRADELSGIGHFGLILLGLDDGLPLEVPVAGAGGSYLAPEGVGGGGSGKNGTSYQGHDQHVRPRDQTVDGLSGHEVGTPREVDDRADTTDDLGVKRPPSRNTRSWNELSNLIANERPADVRQILGPEGKPVTYNAKDYHLATYNAADYRVPMHSPKDGSGGGWGAMYPAEPWYYPPIPGATAGSQSLQDTGPTGGWGNPDGPNAPTGTKIPDSILMGTDAQYTGVRLAPDVVPPKSKQKPRLTFLRVFPESLVQIVQYESNLNSPRFGLPIRYLITLNDPREHHTGVGLPLATVHVHWSRVIHLADNLQSSEIFGVPRMRPVLRRLMDLAKLYGSSAEGYWKSCFTGYSFETVPQLGGDVKIDRQGLRDQFEQYQNGLQRAMVLMGMTMKSQAPSVVDPTPQINCQIEAICIKLAIPKRVFMGSERGELASSQDDAKWNDVLKERQEKHVTPRIIVPFIDRLIAVGVLPEPKWIPPDPAEEAAAQMAAQGMPGQPPGGDPGFDGTPKPGGMNGAPQPPKPPNVVPLDGSQEDSVTFDDGGIPKQGVPATRPGPGGQRFPSGSQGLPSRNSLNGFPYGSAWRDPGSVHNAFPPHPANGQPSRPSNDQQPSRPGASPTFPQETPRGDSLGSSDLQAPFGKDGQLQGAAGPGIPKTKTPGPKIKAKAGYSIEWPSMDSNTDKDKAGIALTKTQALTAYIGGQGESLIAPHDYLTAFLDMDDEEAAAILEASQASQQNTMTMPAAGMDGHPTTEPVPPPAPVIGGPPGANPFEKGGPPGGSTETAEGKGKEAPETGPPAPPPRPPRSAGVPTPRPPGPPRTPPAPTGPSSRPLPVSPFRGSANSSVTGDPLREFTRWKELTESRYSLAGDSRSPSEQARMEQAAADRLRRLKPLPQEPSDPEGALLEFSRYMATMNLKNQENGHG